MFGDAYQLSRHRPTPCDLLNIFREIHRQQSLVDPEADPEAVLNLSTTVADWRYACDLHEWCTLARWLNAFFNIDIAPNRWKVVLEPASKRTLKGVCELITETEIERIKPVSLGGSISNEAGAFLAIRKLLMHTGKNVQGLRPSSPLAPHLASDPELFYALAVLAPGKLPPLKVDSTLYRAVALVYLTSLISACIADALGWPLVSCLSAVVCLLSFLSPFVPIPHPKITLPLRTFRDLSRALTTAEDWDARTGRLSLP